MYKEENHLIMSSFLFNNWTRSGFCFSALLVSAFVFYSTSFFPVFFEEMVVSERRVITQRRPELSPLHSH